MRVIDLVGPKGYIHGWIFVGAPGVGARVSHPSLGAGTVTSHNGSTATVKFDRSGASKSFTARAGKAGSAAKLAPRPGSGKPVKPKTASAARPSSASERLQQARASGVSKSAGTAFAGNQSDTHVETYKDGSKWISKTLPSETDADREELAGKISDILGAGAPAIVRDSANHVHEPFVPGKVAASLYHDGMSAAEEDAVSARLTKLIATPEGKRIGLLDTLIGNQDRHLGNWMISPDGKPVPIDHNYSWAVVDTKGNLDTSSPFAKAVYGPGDHARAVPGQLVKPADFSKAQLDGWQAKLAALAASVNPAQRQQLALTLKAFKEFRAGEGLR